MIRFGSGVLVDINMRLECADALEKTRGCISYVIRSRKLKKIEVYHGVPLVSDEDLF